MFGAISLVGSVTNPCVVRNHLGGNGASAFANEQYLVPDDAVASNTFAGNNIADFDSEVADLLFHENMFFGHVATVIDLGPGNWVSGWDPGPPPATPGRDAGDTAEIGRDWDPVRAPLLQG